MEEHEDQAVDTPVSDKKVEPDFPPEIEALVKEWTNRVLAGKKHHEPAFKEMKKNVWFAKYGADKDWISADNYVVPIINRHINQAVSQLYAKNPKIVVKRRERLLNKVWDGTMDALKQASQAAQMSQQQGMPPPPEAVAVLEEAQAIRKHHNMLDRMAKTMTILWEYFQDEQDAGFKKQLKALVRRTKVTSVGYVKLGFQRDLEMQPEIGAQISDVTEKINATEQLVAEMKDGKHNADSARVAELKASLADLEHEEYLVSREGPVFHWPRSWNVIPDPACTHLKTFQNARWVAEEFLLTPSQIEIIYNVDVGSKFKTHKGVSGNDTSGDRTSRARVFEIWDKKFKQHLAVCEGYHGFLRAPSEPDVFMERFFPFFPLVFNETEIDDSDEKGSIFPRSDVKIAQPTQEEYNRSRQGLREHRIANRPYYITGSGVLETKDRDNLAHHESHAIIELTGILLAGQKIEDVIQRGPSVPIDPNQYEVNMLFTDMLRTVGVQEANLGGTSSATATESTIAENSRTTASGDNTDDLDELLTDIARAGGQMMLMEMSKESVEEIVGPGAVWPDAPQTREEVSKELLLRVKAGSSGRPNKAAELANLERAMPYLLQMPGVNPMSLGSSYADLLDIPLDDLLLDGLPSITAMNAAAGQGGPTAVSKNGNDPKTQGGKGANNAPNPQQKPPGPQAAFPSA